MTTRALVNGDWWALPKEWRHPIVIRDGGESTTDLLDQTNGLLVPYTRRLDGHRHEINATDDILNVYNCDIFWSICVCRSRAGFVITTTTNIIIIIIIIINDNLYAT